MNNTFDPNRPIGNYLNTQRKDLRSEVLRVLENLPNLENGEVIGHIFETLVRMSSQETERLESVQELVQVLRMRPANLQRRRRQNQMSERFVQHKGPSLRIRLLQFQLQWRRRPTGWSRTSPNQQQRTPRRL